MAVTVAVIVYQGMLKAAISDGGYSGGNSDGGYKGGYSRIFI